MGAQPKQMQFTEVVCNGAGNIGAGWVVHFLRAGLDVVVYDPALERKAWLDEFLVRAMPNLERLGRAPVADTSLEWITDLAEAIIASSSAGFLAKDLRRRAKEPDRIIIGHPFNPPYPIPLVEIAGGEDAPEAAASAAEFYKATECEVIALRREIEGYIGGPALLWAVMGRSSIFFLETQDPTSSFVRPLVAEIKAGFAADADFVRDDGLIDAYAEEVRNTIGSAGQLPLIETRTEGVIGIRRALEFASKDLAEPGRLPK
ncbi:hypothetical protein GOL82_30330 [Sinorhizobium medicae]|nr:hypothetical protein [Sinorhizobium medicae]MDX0420197.1 hypothetical protein [Sinorhizobium medicae]MDX1035402.1 hypothetical protein [Sinorhizobium medicae]